MITLKSTSKKASKLRREFQERYNGIAKRFNQVCIDMDNLLAEIAGEEVE